MKKLMLILGLGLMFGMVNINNAEAQIHASVNINVQPAWGPSGYDYAEFYYIPEINVYYDIVHQLFYYYQRGRWISALFLPVMYSHYDFYSLYKVVLNGVHYPWKYNNRHRITYKRYCYNYAQVPIFYMREPRYHHARNNFHGWVEPRYMPRDNGRPHSHDFSKNTRNGRIGSDYRSPANNNKREAVNDRSKTPARNSATVNGRSTGNDSRRNLTDNSRSSSDTRSRNVSAGNRSKNSDNSRSSSVRSATRSSEKKSSGSDTSKTSDRSESSRSAKK
ncbi:MAG: hypothetical protein LBG15_12260 [Dysgonamonadaceae bacterium]|jgi:hypothetical protein|nr:hypothetical protein [Dysgonamonadaceae bacterium]